jgi:D-alanyl-D-alanine carboxypeptidase
MNYYEWTNKNKLLTKYKYAIGGKTGFTEKARRTLVTAAKKGPTTLTVVTLNDGNDFEDHENLYNKAFKEYKTYTILKKGYIDIPDEEFYKNRYFYVKERFKYLLKDTEKNKILIKYNLKELYNYKDNDQVGKATIYLDDEKIFETDIFISIKKKKIKIWDLIFK